MNINPKGGENVNIFQLRKSKKMSQEDVAKLVGVDRTSIAKWEAGVAMPTADKLPKIAEVFECTIDDLFKK